MKVPLLDLHPQLKNIEAEVKAAVTEVLDSTQYVLGPKVESLETAITEYSASAHKSIAVLPFVNMSDDGGDEYCADGLAEELLNMLVKIP